jgi:hypothetical protein
VPTSTSKATRGLERPAKLPGDQLMRSMAVFQASLIQGILKSDMPMQRRLHPRVDNNVFTQSSYGIESDECCLNGGLV